jgi:predicted TIM-barrel fold metal-dependent hydrolase
VHRVEPELIELVADTSLELFGAARCLFGTNFPIEKLWTGLDTLVGAWQDALGRHPEDVRSAVFSETAMRVYGLGRP